ncbi:MAG: hypothetical protein IJE81_06285 [Oscillospiraceae bacterium]|nr:hypothetical protein [Oscillospiraceae bacterium]
MIRKTIVCLLSILLIGILTLPVSAAEPVSFTICASADSAASGNEIEFEVTVSSNTACTSFGLILNYDTSVFEITGGTCTMSDSLFSVFDAEKGFAYLFDNPSIPNGTIGTFTMRVKDSAPNTSTAVSGITSVKNGSDSISSELIDAAVRIYGSGAPTQIKPDGNTSIPQKQTQPPVTEQAPSAQSSATNAPETDTLMPDGTSAGDESTSPETRDTASPATAEAEQHQAEYPLPIQIIIALLLVSIAACIALLVKLLKKKR